MKLLRSSFGFIFILLISLIPLLPLFHQGLPLTHDGQDHVARIANFYLSLSEGNIIPRWAENLNWGYGHPILMFLYPLSSYFASLFHFLGFSLVDSVKLVFGVSFILSGIFMYLWLKEFNEEFPSITGSILYLFAPYRFVDLYVRGAIGEHVAFVFPPIICFFLIKLSKRFNRFYFAGASISVAALVLAHNAISLMFIPFIIFYSIYLIWNSKRRRILIYQYTIVLILGFALSAFFWIPAFIEGKYTLRDIVTGAEVLSRFVPFQNLIYSSWSYGQTGDFSVQVGLLGWTAVFISPYLIYSLLKKKSKEFILILGTLLYFALSIFLMLPQSKLIWTTFTILEKFQFPWRFLSVSIFATALLAATLTNCFSRKWQVGILIVGILYLFFSNTAYWVPHAYLEKSESFYSGIYKGTTDTGESSPIWSVRFMEHAPAAHVEVIKGSAIIKELSRNSTVRSYEINAQNRSRIRENTLYFPGWRVYIDGERYESLQFQDPQNRGLMTFYIKPGKHKVDVEFKDTRLRMVSYYASVAALFAVLFAILTNRIPIKIQYE